MRTQSSAQENAMNNTVGFKTRTPKPDRAEGTEEAREFTQQGASYTKDMYEKTKAAAEETNRVIEQTYSALAKSAADFNVQWIEIIRFNTNSAFDFSRQLVGVKSPSEFLELWAAHARKQFENFTQQAQHLAGLAQKVTTDAVGPLQAGVKSAFSKAA
jgi:phasin